LLLVVQVSVHAHFFCPALVTECVEQLVSAVSTLATATEFAAARASPHSPFVV